MRSYKNLASEFARPRSVTCIHISQLNTANETHQGLARRYAGIFGGLLSKHLRYRAFTLFEAGSGIKLKVESKTGNSRMDRYRKSYLPNKEKNSTYLVPHWILTWADWCGARFALATNLSYKKQRCTWKFHLPYAIPDQASLLCANFVPISISPTLYGLLYICRHVPQPKDQWYWDPQSNRPKAKIWKVHEVVVVYIVVDDLELLQRWSPAGQLKLKLLSINNCLN